MVKHESLWVYTFSLTDDTRGKTADETYILCKMSLTHRNGIQFDKVYLFYVLKMKFLLQNVNTDSGRSYDFVNLLETGASMLKRWKVQINVRLSWSTRAPVTKISKPQTFMQNKWKRSRGVSCTKFECDNREPKLQMGLSVPVRTTPVSLQTGSPLRDWGEKERPSMEISIYRQHRLCSVQVRAILDPGWSRSQLHHDHNRQDHYFL